MAHAVVWVAAAATSRDLLSTPTRHLRGNTGHHAMAAPSATAALLPDDVTIDVSA